MVNWESPLNILLDDTVCFIAQAPKSVQAGLPFASYLDVLGICLTAYCPTCV